MNKTNKIRYFPETGFTETLLPITLANPNINPKACFPIYMNGMNSNKINFFQSEFPNLTKIKPLIRLNQNSVKIETPKKEKPKVSFAIPNSNKTKTYKSHYFGCKNISNFFLKEKINRFIQIGSSMEYGLAKSPQKENFKCEPKSVYGSAKFLSTQYLLNLYKK